MVKMTSGFTGRNSNRANTAFTIGLFTILAAWCFQYIGGYLPCELCLAQRVPYYVGLPLLAIIIATWTRLPPPLRMGATLGVAAIFLWGSYIGVYHSGVEWGLWPGPTSCTGTGGGVSFDALDDINAARVVPCDKVQWSLLGLSFAGYNAILSAVISGFLVWSALGQFTRWRREGK